MSTKEEMGGAGQANEHIMANKRRVLDDDVEFISSNPVKKTRLTEQKHAQVSQDPMKSPLLPHPPPPPALATPPALAPSPPPTTSPPPTSPPPPLPQAALIAKPTTPAPNQTLTADRRRSMCDAKQAKAPGLDLTLEARGKSLPVLEKFAFPQSLAPLQPRSRQLSEAISPKQLPQVYRAPPEAGANINHSSMPTPSPSSENSVTLDQISCLDFNGTPTNTPGFDVSQVFSADGGIMGSVGCGNAANLMHEPAPLNPTSSPHNPALFMTHSTGNFMVIPQGKTGLSFSTATLQNHNHTKERFVHEHPTTGNMIPRQSSPSSVPKSKPPCPHCVRTRLIQSPALMNYMPTHHPANHSPNYHTPPAPVNNNNNNSPMTRPAPSHPTPTSYPPSQLVNNNSLSHRQQQHNNHNNHHHQNHQPAPSPSMTMTTTNPSFLQDIAQTIQTSFPYAQVAVRHGMAPATVAEVLASLVIVPLLLRGGVGSGDGRLPPRGG